MNAHFSIEIKYHSLRWECRRSVTNNGTYSDRSIYKTITNEQKQATRIFSQLCHEIKLISVCVCECAWCLMPVHACLKYCASHFRQCDYGTWSPVNVRQENVEKKEEMNEFFIYKSSHTCPHMTNEINMVWAHVANLFERSIKQTSANLMCWNQQSTCAFTSSIYVRMNSKKSLYKDTSELCVSSLLLLLLLLLFGWKWFVWYTRFASG